MKTIDFHTHFFSSVFFKTLAMQSPLAGGPEQKLRVIAGKTGIEIPSDDLGEHVARWTRELDRHGVERCASFASVPEEVGIVGEAAAMSNGRLAPIAFVNPRAEGAAGRVRSLLSEKGFKGVLVFPAMHHFDIGSAECRPLLDALSEHKAVIYVHCGLLVVKLRDLLGLPRPQDLAYANPLSVIPAANAHPAVRFVIPHFGAGFFRETLMAGAQCPNVFVDTSSSNGWIATQSPRLTLREVFAHALEVFGPQRILFGTDSNTFPPGWRVDRFEEQRAALSSCGASAADQELVFGGNARALI
jgi:predicted TIM-barrel fold metal-dependent hydrolase